MSKHTQSKKDFKDSQDADQPQTTSSSVEDFKLLGRLGDGAYSQVYKVKRFEDGETYALKKVKLINLSEKEKENAINEVRILASINHKNVISYKEAFIEPNTQSLCIVMEYADNGDLFQKICEHQKENNQFPEQDIWRIFIQIVRGLKSLHDLNIMHRDLKSANVFLNKDYTVKLGDMNVSKVANQRGLNYTQTGTPYYASPEVWRDEPYDIKSDVWSLGCVLYEMICLRPPFQASDMQGLYKRVIRGQYPRIPKTYSLELWQMVKSLLSVSAQSRPDSKQIMNMSVFQNKIKELFPDEPESSENELLKTIRLPKNLMYLSNRLPNPNYEKKNMNSFKLNKSLHNKRNSNAAALLPGEDIRITNIHHAKSISNKREDISLPKISSKAKLVAKNDYSDIEKANVKHQNQPRAEILAISNKKNSSPISKATKDTRNNDDQQDSSSVVIMKESMPEFKPVDQTQDTDMTYDDQTKSSMPVLDINRSVILNSDQPNHSKPNHSNKRDYSNPSPENLKRDTSLKKLIREHSVESGLMVPSNRSKLDQESMKPVLVTKQKIQDIYNLKQSNKLILYQSGDKKVKSIDPASRNYMVIGKQMDDIEPTQPIIKPINLNLQIKGNKHQPKKSQQYIQNISRIAQVYAKGSLSPTHPILSKNRNFTYNQIQQLK